jgi:hypothetical protein
MVQSNLRSVVFLVGVTLARGAMAQGSRLVTIDPAGETIRVYTSYMDAAAQENFARMFEIPRYQDYRPHADPFFNAFR